MGNQNLSVLLEKYICGALSPEERRALILLLDSDTGKEDLEAFIDEQFRDPSLSVLPAGETGNIIFQRIMDARKNAGKGYEAIFAHRRVIPFRKRRLWIAAAVIIVILSGSATFCLWQISMKKNNIPAVAKHHIRKNDASPPSVAKAVITLGNGQQIILDSAANGVIASDGYASVSKLKDGQIIYSSKETALQDKGPVYNMVSVPRGSRVVAVTLSDGTKVWLNAASSLRYPTIFAGNERRVQATGEVYFEVAKDKTKKFVIDAHSVITEVFGTHLNIRSYDDDEYSQVTLLEGSVKVIRGKDTRMLEPGEQAQFLAGSVVVDKADMEQVVAWKDGRFQFKGTDIKEVMKEIARWYDLETVYEGGIISQHFRGGISRNVDASSVFKMLEATDAVHFRIEDKKIIVTP